MKKIATLIIASLLLVNASQAQVANKCCSGTTVAPEITLGIHPTPVVDTLDIPAPVLAVTASSDLPNTEYIVTKRNTKAITTAGTPDTADVIIGADADGIFKPYNMTRYGVTLVNGDTFELTAVGYNLALVKNLAEKLLNGTQPGAGPCCSLFVSIAGILGEPALAGFCDSVRNAGILDSSDINGMNEVLAIFDVFSDGQTTIPSVISTLQTINTSGVYISVPCGGTATNNFLPYGVNRHKKYGYERNGSVAVRQLSDVSLFLMYPNPTTAGDVYIFFTTTKQVDLNINVYDAIGQKVHSQTLGNVSGDFNAQIPTGNLTAGMYFVELTDGHSSQTHKLQVR